MPVRHLVAHFRREVRAQARGDEVGGETSEAKKSEDSSDSEMVAGHWKFLY